MRLLCLAVACVDPTLSCFLFQHIPRYVGAIWVAVRDPKSSIREAAIESLASAMEIIRRRSAVSRERYYTQCVAETRKGLEDKVSNAIHGSLLAGTEVAVA